jgi:exodeoxyribonuclease-1
MAALTSAAASIEPIHPPSDHVEQQIYGCNFISDTDSALSRQFHSLPWQARVDVAQRFQDDRLRRLARRLIFFESPHVLDDSERRRINDDIVARRRGEGRYATVPWTTISQALSQLDAMDGELSDTLKDEFRSL